MSSPTSPFPGASHYGRSYERKERLASYWHQVDECVRLRAANVLVVGVGTGTVSHLLRVAGLSSTTLDIDPACRPDVLGDVRALPFADGAFDAALCCQVLEHLPFEEFENALGELGRVSRHGLVLSLPDNGRYLRLGWQTLARRRHFLWELPMTRLYPRHYAGGHLWEVNAAGFPRARIERGIRRAGFDVETTYRVYEFPWHRFWRLRRRG